MGTAVSKRKNLRSDAISSVAAKVRAARAFGEYLSHNHPENRNGSDHLLAETFIGQESYSPVSQQQHHHHHHHHNQQQQQQHPCSPSPAENQPPAQNKRRLSLISNGKFDRSLSEEERPEPPRVYTISGESGMLGESLELEVLKGSQELRQPPASHHEHHDHAHHHHHHAHHHRSHAHHHSQPLQSTSSTHNISHAGWGGSRQGSRECSSCIRAPQMSSQHSFDLEHLQSHEGARQRKKLERMYSVDRVSDDVPIHSWFPKENMFNFHTASTTMQAISAFRGCAERKRRKQENDSAVVIQRNFRKHLRMVGSRRVRAQTFADRREKSFSRSWSDPTPIKTDSLHDSGESADLQASCGALDEDFEDLDWEAEKELEAASCEGDDFVPPKIMLISSKVPRAEYIPTIIRRDDPSIIPILYDHEHATFEDILEEIEKKLNIYRKGCKIWKMLIFCQGGPGHLYLLKNKVATFAKVEKEEDMILFWKRLSRLMSKINPEPDLIHIMGCYVLGNANGEKLFQNLKNLMTPHTIVFESPLELSAQGKQVIETYFDFRLYRLWKTHQHSKLLDYDDIL
ncbi:NMDA receptor synaptonuclear signaling and neuronal migration factor [Acipenser ruthenus]|uniref:NMDA receptor synaptonuclear signaling and neuronal migration factor n=1 Tax=Acipenser ruthenus TaxID=7906 RepID=UPI001560AF6D|nr:NMDA receptor synaptonuclear signaling and neuronal migration factor [Acipenser ruthenus]